MNLCGPVCVSKKRTFFAALAWHRNWLALQGEDMEEEYEDEDDDDFFERSSGGSDVELTLEELEKALTTLQYTRWEHFHGDK